MYDPIPINLEHVGHVALHSQKQTSYGLTYITIKSLLHKKSFSKYSTFKQIDVFFNCDAYDEKEKFQAIYVVSFTNIYQLQFVLFEKGTWKPKMFYQSCSFFFFFNLCKAQLFLKILSEFVTRNIDINSSPQIKVRTLILLLAFTSSKYSEQIIIKNSKCLCKL